VTVLQRAVDRLSRPKECADPMIPVKEDRAPAPLDMLEGLRKAGPPEE
jgi:hypothetical protein